MIYSSKTTHNFCCKNVEDWINILVSDQAWILWIGHTLLKGINKFVSTSHISSLTLVIFKTKDLHVWLLNNWEFFEKWYTEKHSLLGPYMQLHPYFPHLLSTMGRSWSKKRAHHAAKHLWGLWNLAHGREYFSCGCKWTYI
jgi:hypothetical protein